MHGAFNRRIEEQTPSGTTEFTYDYAGRRISGWVSPNNYGNQGRIYWDNQQIAFRAADGVNFDHQDTLGTERMRTIYDGSVGATYQSLAWGDGLTATVNNSYADQDSSHYAGLEHDGGSETEHAQFRNYSSVEGRWLAPDPYLGSYDLTNPQSFNRYAYVLNNPMSSTDPSGLLDCKFGPCPQPPGCDDGCPPVSTPPPSSGDPGCFSCGGTSGGGGGGGGQPGSQKPYVFKKTVYAAWLNNFDLQFSILTSIPFGSVLSNNTAGLTAPSNGRNCSAAPASAGQYVAATAEAALLTGEFASGLGAGNQTFGPNTATSQVLGQSAGVQEVLGAYLITGQSSGLYTFGASGAYVAGGNPAAQFVGSFRYSISGGVLTVTNTTSLRSLTYDQGPQYQRGSFPTPGGNVHQTFQIGLVCH